jgi:hypothetical protein
MRRILLLSLLALSCARGGVETSLVGSRVDDLESRVGVQFRSWAPSTSAGYEVACELDRPVTLFGQEGTLCAVRRGGKVAAVDFRVAACDARRYEELRRAVVSAFGLGELTGHDVYVVRGSGVVHVRPDGEGARVVVTDEAYGKLYAAQVLRDGLTDLTNELRPH